MSKGMLLRLLLLIAMLSPVGSVSAVQWTMLLTPLPSSATPEGTPADIVWAWGDNTHGQLGDGTTIDRGIPIPLAALSEVTQVAGGGQHSLALKSDGTVWAWGDNTYGQLGDGTTIQHNTPTQVPTLSNVTAISVGRNHSLALRTDGTLWAWGDNRSGQLGDGTTVQRNTPVQVNSLTGVTAVSGGANFSLALKTDGTVWSWGSGASGQLGNGSNQDKHSPVRVVTLVGITKISAHRTHGLALDSTGSVWAWGDGLSGQLGDGNFKTHYSPIQVTALTGMVNFGGGNDFSLAQRSDGTVWAWGLNAQGQLGIGSTTNTPTPTQAIGLQDTVATSRGAGDFHGIAATSTGTVWTWGYNNHGQLGDEGTTQRNTPALISGLRDVVTLAAGDYHSLAIASSFTVSGRVLLGPTTAIEGVTITSSTGRSTTTDEAGYYTLTGLLAGGCEIMPSLAGYIFSPLSRTVTVSEAIDDQSFWGRTVEPFLDFPADYASTVLARAFVYGTSGYINTYFDHAYPNYAEPVTDPIRRYDGEITDQAYGGHNGIDFDDSSTDQTTLTSVLAAAPGEVITTYDDCEKDGKSNCPKLLGNHVVIDHQNGYGTVYGHLKKGLLVNEGDVVYQGQRLGEIGSTGNSSGPHIHFGVMTYTTNKRWEVVDPFGWTPLDQEDPWVTSSGPDSFYLWKWRFENGITFRTDSGALVTDPAGLADSIGIAPTTGDGEATAIVTNPPVPGLNGIMRSLGRYFRLVLDSLPPTTEMGMQGAPDYDPDITITMPFLPTELRHLDPTQLAIQRYDTDVLQWINLPTSIDLVNNIAVASTKLTGDFALNAPLLCSGDSREPDDEPEAATPVWLNDVPRARLLDVPEDADWGYFAAVEGVEYTLATQNLVGNVDPFLRLYDSGGTTLLATDDNSGGGLAALIQWTAPRTETYFVEVSGGPAGSTGCSAVYELVLIGNPAPQVGHELLSDVMELSWRHDNAAVIQYEGWRSDLPYFDMVASEGVLKTNVNTGDLGALVTLSDGLSPTGGHFYRVRGKTDGNATPASSELGAFSFSLVRSTQ